MGYKSIIELMVNFLGLGILIWFFSIAIADLIKAHRQKTIIHNLLIIGITLIYSLKVLLKDLLGIM